jgi:hypothetical protein
MTGFSGIVLTGLVAAVSVEALRATARDATTCTTQQEGKGGRNDGPERAEA